MATHRHTDTHKTHKLLMLSHHTTYGKTFDLHFPLPPVASFCRTGEKVIMITHPPFLIAGEAPAGYSAMTTTSLRMRTATMALGRL